jgi:hypothetical protein
VLALALLFFLFGFPDLLLLLELGAGFGQIGLCFFGSLAEGVKLHLVGFYIVLDARKLSFGFF